MLLRLLLIGILSLGYSSLFAQNKTLTGVIKDDKGTPIIGANIVEKGTTNGTISDIDGNFTLSVGDKAVLEVSYIGFKNQTVTVPSGGG